MVSRFVRESRAVGTSFSREFLHSFVRDFEGIKTSIRGFCQIAGGNQGAVAADRPLEPHGAPRITLDLQLALMM